MIEAEVGLVFGRQLSARSTPYTVPEVWDVLAAIAPCLEAVGTRLALADATGLDKLAGKRLWILSVQVWNICILYRHLLFVVH